MDSQELETIRQEGGYEWTPKVKDKAYKWILPVEVDTVNDDCYVTLPEDILSQLNWKEGDMLKWVDRGAGMFEVKKSN